jgi:hypothetical protein
MGCEWAAYCYVSVLPISFFSVVTNTGFVLYSMGAAAVGPDPLDGSGTPGYTGANGGTGVGQRLIPEEPMSLILNLGISRECLFFPPRL